MHSTNHIEPGTRVIVTQQVARPREPHTITIEGVVVSYGQSTTGSWFAHAKSDRLWLERLTLRKDDGEIVVCNLDRYSRVDPAPLPSSARKRAS